MHDLDQVQFELPGEVAAESEYQMWELEMADRLLEVSSEQELEQFLGDLLSSVTRTVAQGTADARKFWDSDAGKKTSKAVGSTLVGLAAPVSDLVAGRHPGVAQAIGAGMTGLGTYLASRELEAMSQEDQ